MKNGDSWSKIRINEEDILTTLNALINIKEAYIANLVASPSKYYQKVLTAGLEKKNSNSKENVHYFLENISAVLSISEREILANEEKDFVEAFALAQHFKTLFLQNYLVKVKRIRQKKSC